LDAPRVWEKASDIGDRVVNFMELKEADILWKGENITYEKYEVFLQV